MERQKILLIYNTNDYLWVSKLKPLIVNNSGNNIDIELWDNEKILNDPNWIQNMTISLTESRMLIMLLSNYFISQENQKIRTIYHILDAHIADGLFLFPIEISSCLWQNDKWLSQIYVRSIEMTHTESMIIKEIHEILSEKSLPNLPIPGAMLPKSQPYKPPIFLGIKIDNEDPLHLDFILCPGDDIHLSESNLLSISYDLLHYFLVSITLPEESLWVNFSPIDSNNIISSDLENIKMGQDLLKQDYLLKQFNASLIFPESEIGQKYWQLLDKNPNNAITTFTRVWILPKTAEVFEHEGLALVKNQELQVLSNQDRKSLKKQIDERIFDISNVNIPSFPNSSDAANVTQKILLSQIENEVNLGRYFSNVRQIYSCLILGQWYKKIHDNIFKFGNIHYKKVHENYAQKIHKQYFRSIEKGVFKYIKEVYLPHENKIDYRQYFSGGFEAKNIIKNIIFNNQKEGLPSLDKCYLVSVRFYPEDGGNKLINNYGSPDDESGGIDFTIPVNTFMEVVKSHSGKQFQWTDNALDEIQKYKYISFKPTIERIEKIKGLDQLIEASNNNFEPIPDEIKILERVLEKIMNKFMEKSTPSIINNTTINNGNVANLGSINSPNYGSITTNINQNRDDINHLIDVLCKSAESFPQEKQKEVLIELDNIKKDLQTSNEATHKGLKTRLKLIISAATAVASIAGGAAAVSDNINEFTTNVLELGEKIGIAKETLLNE